MTTWTQTQTRIVHNAIELKPLKVLITLLVLPFWLIGGLIGLVWFIGALFWQATWDGTKSVRNSLTRQ
jgi:hypothetical protein